MKVDIQKFRGLCQLEKLLNVFFLCLFISSCSHEVISDNENERPIIPNWFKIDKQFGLRGENDEYTTHPFFDIPFSLNQESEIRYFSIMASGSKYQYNLDMLSGKIYKVRDHCELKDIWDNYSGKILLPNFDLGIVPQVYDEMGNPQRIIIFKNEEKYGKFEYDIKNFHEARIVGSVMSEICDSYPCGGRDKWKQSQILVGVNKNDPEFSDITTIGDLKKKVDWKYSKAFLLNAFGSHQVGTKFYPAFRINSELGLEESIKNFNKRSRITKIADDIKFRDSCIDLYTEIWGNISKIRALKHNQQTEFLNFFKTFYAKDSKQYFLCQKVVRPANINVDPERHWLFAYISAFTSLERIGLYYSCYEKGWAYNARVDDQNYYVDQNKENNRCRARDFEKSFDQAINGMSLLKNQMNRNFHYIEYDSAIGGSHQKLYSWILEDVRRTSCQKENTGIDFFPQDVVWPAFKADEEKTIH